MVFCRGKTDVNGLFCRCDRTDCHTCSASGFCMRCKNGRFLYDGSCVAVCPTGYIGDYGGLFDNVCVLSEPMATFASVADGYSSAVSFSGTDTSYMEFQFEKGLDENMLTLQFRTVSNSSVLTFVGPESSQTTDYLALGIVQGKVLFAFNAGE